MCFRIAVRSVEAWLLADREGLARFLGVPPVRIPADPDQLPRPKETLVQLATRSLRRVIRQDVVPRPGRGRPVGPAYSSQLIDFIESSWCPGLAAGFSDSLRRCQKRITELVGA
jgi:hypothetical protein